MILREYKQKIWLGSVLAVLFVLAASCAARGQEQPVDEEYRVYEAVLKLMNTIPKQDPHVAIYERTLTSKCAVNDEIPVFAKGCSFFWVKPDTDEIVEQNLRSRFHGLHRSTWKNFKASNATSITLHDPITAPWKHKFIGPVTPAEFSDEWASPDMTIYFSRVGFDKGKTEALVYVLVFTYLDQDATALSPTTGDYLRLRRGADKQWALAGRVSYLKQDQNLTASLLPNLAAIYGPDPRWLRRYKFRLLVGLGLMGLWLLGYHAEWK